MPDLRERLQELADAAARDAITPGPAHAIRRGRRRRHRIVGGIAAALVVAVATGVAGLGQLAGGPTRRPLAPAGPPTTAPVIRADPVPDEVAAQLWEDTKTALSECGVRSAGGPRLIARGTDFDVAWVLGARPPRGGKGMCWATGESGPGGGAQVGTTGSASSPSREIVASGSSGDSYGSVSGYVTKRATLVRVVFNDGREPLEVTPVQAGSRFPVNFYIVFYRQQGSSRGWRVAEVQGLDRNERILARCRTGPPDDTCGED